MEKCSKEILDIAGGASADRNYVAIGERRLCQDKYAFERKVKIDCKNRLHICKAACCSFGFNLSKQDVDEGVIEWNPDNPYRIAQDSDGYCRHLDRETYRCRVYQHRPLPCRSYDCRNDILMWRNFENSIAGPTLKAGVQPEADMQAIEPPPQAGTHIDEERILRLLTEDFPEHCAILNQEQLREAINYGMERADRYGLNTEESAFWYLSLMFMLGSNFDEDEQIPFIRPILNSPGAPESRVLRLYDEVMEYFERIHEQNDYEHVRGVLRAKRQDFSTLEQRLEPDYDTSMIRLLKNLQPLKCKELGKDGIIDFIHRGIESAKLLGFATLKGFALHTVLRFYLGEGYYEDPLYPWIGNLAEGVSGNEPEFVENLYNSAISFLKTIIIPRFRDK